MFIIELGVIYKVIYHILEGNSELPKADFKIFDVELITGGITSFIRLIPFYILLALIGYIDNFIIYFIGLIILFILFNLIGLVLAHGINTDSYIDGIVKLPEMIKSIEIGTLIIFIIVNVFLGLAAAVVMFILSMIFIFIPILGFIITVIFYFIILGVLILYFVLASTYMYKEYVITNKNEFNENEFNIVLKYPRNTNTTPETNDTEASPKYDVTEEKKE